MNVLYFPFDTQKIEFNIESKHPSSKLELKFNNTHIDNTEDISLCMSNGNDSNDSNDSMNGYNNILCLRKNYKLTEWEIDNKVYIKEYSNNDEYKCPRIHAFINSKRIYKYYIWNIIFINSLIQLISLSASSIDYDKSEDRLNISVMLLLTNIAFKLTNNSSLPNTSYLTHIDKYQITAVGFHSLVIIQNVIVKFVNNVSSFDFWSYLFLIGVYLLIHMIFIVRTYYIIKTK